MTLLEVILDLGRLDEEETIYLQSPWLPEAKALVARAPDHGLVPAAAAAAGYEYFLEVSIALEVLEDWIGSSNGSTSPSAREKCMRVIDYAVNDA